VGTVVNGVGIFIPEACYTNADVEERAGYGKMGGRSGLIRLITGVEERHYASEGEHSSYLAARAGANAMKDAGVCAEDIDVVIFCAVTQDFAEPATANVVADILNIRNAYAFDVKNGCNAFLTGMDIADSLMATGKAKTVLIASGEALSRWIRFDYTDVEELKERSPVTLSVGDGGGAFIMQREADTERGICKTFFHTFSELWNNNVMWGGGVVYPRDPEKMYIPGTTKNLVDKHIIVGVDFLKKTVLETGWKLEDIDCAISSQVAKWITDKTQKELRVSKDKIISVLKKWGNVGACNIPLATYEAIQTNKLSRGKRVVFYGGAVGFNVGCITMVF